MGKKDVNSAIKHDVLIIGAGISGLYAAIKLHDLRSTRKQKANIAVLTKVHPLRSNSIMDFQGINAVLNQKDNVKFLHYDTVKTGEFLSNQDLSESMAKSSKEIIEDLENLGLLFFR